MTVRKHLNTTILAAAALLLATSPGFAQTQLFSETWPNTQAAFTVGTSGNFTENNAWSYTIGATAGTIDVGDPGTPLSSVALRKTVAGTGGTPNSQFVSTAALDVPGADLQVIVIKAKVQIIANSGSATQTRLAWLIYGDPNCADPATGQFYGVAPNVTPNLTTGYSFRVRDSLGATTFDAPVPTQITAGNLYDVTTSFTKFGLVTKVEWYVTENGAFYISGSRMVARAVEDATTLDRAVVQFTRYSMVAMDDIQFVSAPAPPTPVIAVTPGTQIFRAAGAGGDVESTVTISNDGSAPLTVSSVSFLDQTVPGAFTIVSGGVPPEDTITTAGGAHPTHDIVFNFHNTLAVGDTPASATVLIDSNDLGAAGSVTTATLLGHRSDTFTWNTGQQDDWVISTMWSPQGIPGPGDTAIIDSGVTTRTTDLGIAPNGPAASIASLSLTGGELRIWAPTGNVQFSIGQIVASLPPVSGAGSFTLDGGLLQVKTNTRLGQNVNCTGNLDIRSGTFLSNGNILVGNANPSTGIVTMSGGTVNGVGAASNLEVATAQNSYGSWTQSNGATSVSQDLLIGNAAGASGAFAQSGGNVTATRDFIVGNNATANATCQVSGGVLNVGDQIYAGSSGNGQLSISGSGTINVTGTNASQVGANSGATGAIDVAGGALNLTNGHLYVSNVAGATGSLNITGGAVNITSTVRDLVVGRLNGHGSLSMSGGQLTVGSDLSVAGGNAGATTAVGTVSITSGAVNVGNNLSVAYGTGAITIGGEANVQIVNNLALANQTMGNGSLNVNGGVVNVGGNLMVDVGTGAIAIGGTADVQVTNALVFGTSDVAHGSFNMTGGKLGVSTIRAFTSGSPVTSWSWTGGTIVASTASLPVTITNSGGTLSPGDAGIGTTAFQYPGTVYTQTAGAIAIGIQDVGAADRVEITSAATANLNGGAIDVSLLSGLPSASASWDIVAASDSGVINVGAVTVNLPTVPEVRCWSVTSDSTKITVIYRQAPTLAVVPPTTATLLIDLSSGETSKTKTIGMQNVGEFDLNISSITVFGTSFTLLQPTTFPLTLTAGSTDSATVEFDAYTSGTFYGSIVFDSNDPQSPLVLGLQANVLEAILPASGIESWVRY